MLKRTLWRALRALFASVSGAAAAHYGSDPLWGPLVTTALLTVDKLIREIATRPAATKAR